MQLSRNLKQFTVGVALFLTAYLLFQKSVPAVSLKYALLAGLVLFFLLQEENTAAVWKRLNSPVIFWFGLFWFWILGTSLFIGFLTGAYWDFISNAGSLGVLWILEANRSWGPLLILLFSLNSFRELDSSNYGGSTFLLVCFGAALIGGFVPYIAGGAYHTGEPFRIFSDWHTNSSKILNLFLPFILALSLRFSRKKIAKWLPLMSLFFLGVAGVFLTQSRGGIGSMFIALGCFAVIYLASHRSSGALINVLIVALGIIVVFNLLPSTAGQALKAEATKTQKQTQTGGFGRARHIWPTAFKLIKRRPIIGHPAGTYQPKAKEISSPEASPQTLPHAHSMYLQLLFNGGLIGFLLFLKFSWEMFWESWNRFKSSDYQDFLFVAVGLSFLTNTFVHGLVEPFNYGLIAVLICWFLAGANSAVHSGATQNNSPPKSSGFPTGKNTF